MFYVTRDYHFEAAHGIEGRSIHRHHFRVSLTFRGSRAAFQSSYHGAMLINFHDIDKIWSTAVFPLMVDADSNVKVWNASCEVLAEWISARLAKVVWTGSSCELYSVKVNDGEIEVELRNEDAS